MVCFFETKCTPDCNLLLSHNAATITRNRRRIVGNSLQLGQADNNDRPDISKTDIDQIQI